MLSKGGKEILKKRYEDCGKEERQERKLKRLEGREED